MAEIDLDYYRGIVADYRNDGHWVGVSDADVDELVAEIVQLRAKVERYREHSTTLNTVAYKLAEALGDIPQGQHWSEGNPVELAERLIGQRDQLQADVHALVREVTLLTGERDDALLTIQSLTYGDPR